MTSTHERLVAAAAELTTESGWAGITMGKLADRVGVSRQTVYHEFGSKLRHAEEMVLRELPLLTTHSEPLLDTAKTVVRARVAAYDVALPSPRLDAAIDLIVRVVLSHVMQPSASPRTTADDIAWLASQVLPAGTTPNDGQQPPRPGRARPIGR